MVPNSWMSCHLGDFMEFKNGLNADKSQYGYGLKFVNVMDVFGNDILTEDKIIGRVNVAESQLESNLLKFGDVLFNRTSETFDEIAMSAVYLDDKPAVFGGFVIRARPSNGILSPAYSVYLFQSSKFRNQVIKLGQGAVRANIGQKDLAKVKVSLPPLPEQKKIAQILSTWDKAITVTEKLLANSQQQKKALMQQLLTGKKRLLDKDGVRFGGEWSTTTFGKACVINPARPPEPNNGLVSFVAMENVSEDAKLINHVEKRYTDVAKGFTSFIDGDVVVAKITPCFENGKGAYIEGMKNGIGFGSTEFHVLRSNELSDSKFIYYLTTTSEFRVRGEANMQGSAGQKRVTTEYLRSYKIKIPLLEEQQKIASVLSVADQDIAALQKKLDALKQEKKALMQQLLTGKRRVRIDN